MQRRYVEWAAASLARFRGRGRRMPPRRPVAPDPDRWKTDYIDKGHNEVRLTLFWASNYVNVAERTLEKLMTALFMLAEHGIGLSVVPGFEKTKEFTIEVPFDRVDTHDRLMGDEGDFNWLRGEAAKKFDDQKYEPDPRPRLPVFFCEFDFGHGKTVLQAPAGNSTSTWLPYVLISGAKGARQFALIHEIGHAARNTPAHDDKESPSQPTLRNFMRNGGEGRTMYKYQILDLIAQPRAYFVGPSRPPKK